MNFCKTKYIETAFYLFLSLFPSILSKSLPFEHKAMSSQLGHGTHIHVQCTYTLYVEQCYRMCIVAFMECTRYIALSHDVLLRTSSRFSFLSFYYQRRIDIYVRCILCCNTVHFMHINVLYKVMYDEIECKFFFFYIMFGWLDGWMDAYVYVQYVKILH